MEYGLAGDTTPFTHNRLIWCLAVLNVNHFKVEQVTYIAVEIVAKSFDDMRFVLSHIISHPTCHGVIIDTDKFRQVFYLDATIDLLLALLDEGKQTILENTLFHLSRALFSYLIDNLAVLPHTISIYLEL